MERSRRASALGGAVAAFMACAPVALAGPDCAPVRANVTLSDMLDESSGLAVSPSDPSLLWSHNDDGSTLVALDTLGTILARWAIRPRLADWEDIAAGPCEPHGVCLYLADTGDNAERRAPGAIKILRIAEPDPAGVGGRPATDGGRTAGTAALDDGGLPVLQAEVFPISLPGGPRDIEALFVLPGEALHLVTKGRSHGISVYRYAGALRPDTVQLTEVQRLTVDAQPLADQVTGADASADGSTVAIRTYQSLAFYRIAADTLVLMDDGLVNLRSLRESQGEAVALRPDGQVLLTSEGGFLGSPPSMNVLRCRLS